MKILFLSAYFPPEQAASSFLWENLREDLANEGYNMELHVAIPTRGVSQETRLIYAKKKNEEFYSGRLKIHRFSMMKEGNNPVLRAIRYLLCNIKHYYYGKRAKNVDLIFVGSTPPTQGWMAARVKKKLKVPFVYCLQDIFPDSLVGAGMTTKGSLIWKLGREIEDFTYKHADKIIVISEDFKRNIMDKGVPEDKIEVIYNWVDENKVLPVSKDKNPLFDKYKLDRNKFYVTYTGNIGLTQNLDVLIDIADELQSNSSIHFVVLGEGVCKENVKKIIEKRKLTNISLLPFQPYDDISFVFSLGDVGLVISKENVGQNSVPSKTWSIMSAARPVLASFDEPSELQAIIKKSNAGIFTKANDKDAFKSAILYLYEHPEKCRELGRNGRHFILQNLTREIGTSKYIEVFNQLRNTEKK